MLDDRAKALQYLKLIHTGAEDAASVVARLREFYRQQEHGATQPVDMGPLVEQVVAMTQPRWRDQAQANGRTIHVETDLAAAPPAAGNASELRELLTNLIFNAVDAMPNGGTITISTRWDAAQTGQRRGGKHGSPNGRGSGRIALSVQDTGTGMSEETQRRCLEPFYTTKGEHGTGLGLSMVYGAVRRHGGDLAISSALGEGTTITISLPIYTTPAASERAARRTTATRPLRILVVDDEADVRRVTQALLEADGHAITSVSGGREALEALRGEERFDLVITDRAMPDMSGDQVAETIKTLAPNMKIILLTGFGGLMDTSDIPAADAILAKPVTLTALRRTIAGLRPGDKRAQCLSEGTGQPEEAE
jgi:CheY-like chemotaxis protein